MYNVERDKSVLSGTLGCFFLSLLLFSITFDDFFLYLPSAVWWHQPQARLWTGRIWKLWWLYIVRVDNYERGESELKGEPSRCNDDGNDDDCDDNDLMMRAIMMMTAIMMMIIMNEHSCISDKVCCARYTDLSFCSFRYFCSSSFFTTWVK